MNPKLQRYQALVQEKADLINEQKALFAAVEKRADMAMTDEEKARDDAINARLDTLSADITRENRRRENERAQVNPAASVNITEVRDLYAERGFSSMGEQLLAVHRAALNPGNTDVRLLALTGAGESGTSGEGFMVQQEFTNESLTRMYNAGQIMSRVNRRPVGANANGIRVNVINETSRADGSRQGGLRGYWTNEGGSYTASKPAYRRFSLDLEKLTGLYIPTDELLQDYAALQAEISDGFNKEFTFKCEDAVVEGDGAGKPLGVMNSPAVISVAKETGQAAATIVYANLAKMWSRFAVWARNSPAAAWFYNQDCEQQLFSLALPVGTAALEPRFITFAPDGSLRAFGKPMIPVEYCATLGTTGDLLLLDLNDYRWIDKNGVQEASSIHVYFSTGEQAFRFTYRANGAPFQNSAITPFKGSNTVSSYVKLDTRA